MDRKEFLKGCATGVCACVAATVPCVPAAADAPKPDDWKIPFAQQRFAKLLAALREHTDGQGLATALREMGSYCSSSYDEVLNRYIGNVEGFAEFTKSQPTAEIITYDRQNRVIQITSPERPDCPCPLNSVKAKTPGVVCNCSIGWQQRSWEKLLGKKVRIELKEAVLQGGKRCTFNVHILEA